MPDSIPPAKVAAGPQVIAGQPLARLRNAEEADYEAIVALNAAEVRHTSPMDLERLAMLSRLSSHHKVAEVGGRVVGFLLAMREHTPYENDNYAWFAARYPKFVYIDRVVIGAEYAGRKIGTALYKDLFAYARTCGVRTIACEYNIEPLNRVSKAFHDRFGFRAVGMQRVAGGARLVSLQVAEL
jgi:predicted GNAT superfamily acetyltransferase